jgi:hypothetical protein
MLSGAGGRSASSCCPCGRTNRAGDGDGAGPGAGTATGIGTGTGTGVGVGVGVGDAGVNSLAGADVMTGSRLPGGGGLASGAVARPKLEEGDESSLLMSAVSRMPTLSCAARLWRLWLALAWGVALAVAVLLFLGLRQYALNWLRDDIRASCCTDYCRPPSPSAPPPCRR